MSFYGDKDPGDFGRFDRAVVGFLNILGGEAWFPGLDQVRPPPAPLSLCPRPRA